MKGLQNNMEYKIVRQVLGSQVYVPITGNDYHEIAAAKAGLLESLYIEEKFDVVLENFYEYEMELLRLSTHFMLFSNLSYTKLRNEFNLINRRIINLLSACRLYVDHISHHLSNIFNRDLSRKEEIRSNISHEYDTVLGYRVMDELRNYVQHRGFPVQEYQYHPKRIEGEKKDKLQYSINLYLDVARLNEDGKFKKKILEELRAIDKKNDIKLFVREYVSSISTIHGKNRLILKDQIEKWETTFHSHIEDFKSKMGSDKSIAGLAAVISEENGCYHTPIPIFLEFIEHRRKLERKNVDLKSLVSRYVTSEIV